VAIDPVVGKAPAFERQVLAILKTLSQLQVNVSLVHRQVDVSVDLKPAAIS
jgi:hypothetical protein